MTTYKEIENAVKEAKNILITTHERPDGDALGSVFAISKFLEFFKKSHQVYLKDYDGAQKFPVLNFIKDKSDINLDDVDLLITLDSGDLSRTGLVDIEEKGIKIINIDHHISNDNFGDINLVEPIASSTTEVITKLFNYLNFEITKDIANALLLGLLTDTDNFSNKGTSKEAFNVASGLLAKGANISKINNSSNEKQIDILKLWGKSFNRLKENSVYNCAYTVVSKQEIESSDNYEKVDDLVNFFNNLKDPRFVMVLKEQEECVKVSLRTTREDVDVSKLAIFFGGGGHKKAAGFTINGRVKETTKGWKIV
ncbi:hypothetical protein HOD96_01325 [Candidatus Falkowbacteria bacterium]|jgi:bifunctional oligoribonuclease and PAP phosphatase NrnA|nr:hypothetical protein [Candidatus Falkowbacteria bacterium]MBT4433045.1 hypothetical protein [Candidatus Falkowbacteria bacterium]